MVETQSVYVEGAMITQDEGAHIHDHIAHRFRKDHSFTTMIKCDSHEWKN